MGRSIIVLVLGFIIVSGYTLSQINNTGTSGVTTSIVDYRNLVARNCATSAVNIAVSQLSNNQTLSTYNNLYISDFGGHASLDTTNLSGSTLTEIRGRGWVDGGDTVLIRTVVDLTGGECNEHTGHTPTW